MIRIDDDVIEILQRCRIEGRLLHLPEQLDRKLYVKVNNALEALGAVWSRKQKAHEFEIDPTEMISKLGKVVDTGQAPDAASGKYLDVNPLGFYETPVEVVERMLAGPIPMVTHRRLILEPSAGKGAIIKQLALRGFVSSSFITAIEYDEDRFNKLVTWSRTSNLAMQVIRADFLTWRPGADYDLIYMNPPFAVKKEYAHPGTSGALAYVDHLWKAWNTLQPGGLMVAIAPAGLTYRSDNITSNLADLVRAHGEVEELPEGCFKESGANIHAVMVTLRKPAPQEYIQTDFTKTQQLRLF